MRSMRGGGGRVASNPAMGPGGVWAKAEANLQRSRAASAAGSRASSRGASAGGASRGTSVFSSRAGSRGPSRANAAEENLPALRAVEDFYERLCHLVDRQRVGRGRYCQPRHQHAFDPSFLELNGFHRVASNICQLNVIHRVVNPCFLS